MRGGEGRGCKRKRACILRRQDNRFVVRVQDRPSAPARLFAYTKHVLEQVNWNGMGDTKVRGSCFPETILRSRDAIIMLSLRRRRQRRRDRMGTDYGLIFLGSATFLCCSCSNVTLKGDYPKQPWIDNSGSKMAGSRLLGKGTRVFLEGRYCRE